MAGSLIKTRLKKTALDKISLAVAMFFCMGSWLHAGRAIRVVNHQRDMHKLGYMVQACESGTPKHCSRMRAVRAAPPNPENTAGNPDSGIRLVVKSIKDGAGKKLRMRGAYDVSFFVGGEKMVLIEGVKSNTKLECWDGGAFYFDAKTGEEKEVAWPSVADQRLGRTGARSEKGENGNNHQVKKK